MTEKKPPQTSTDRSPTREERLAAALRENLRRRKVQSRDRQDAEPKED